jgi:hypothetical protein
MFSTAEDKSSRKVKILHGGVENASAVAQPGDCGHVPTG